MELKWKLAFGVALANDILDLTFIGMLPVIGTVLDIISNIALWPVLKTRRSLLTAIEYVPGADPLPIYTLTVFYAYRKRQEGKNRIE